MKEGWHGDDYLILFADAEVSEASARYAVAQSLPGYDVVGLRGWDDWYVKPIVFGGDPNIGDNLVWVDHPQHAQLVTWWNDQYRALKAQGA